jgi:tRNA nucleotidyltransferase/poly(A) polymerase
LCYNFSYHLGGITPKIYTVGGWVRDTLLNAVNAVTEQFTHGTGRHQPLHQFWDSYFGAQDQNKSFIKSTGNGSLKCS